MKKTIKKITAFTLAEVLITLGIIGVVAALTIPTLVANYKKKAYVTQLKKTVNTVLNGYKMMFVEEGVEKISDTEFALLLSHESTADFDYLTKVAGKYFNIVGNFEFNNSTNYHYQPAAHSSHYWSYGGHIFGMGTADGAHIFFEPNGNRIFVDVNGSNKAPNTVGKDFFGFDLKPEASLDLENDTHRCFSQHSFAPNECFTHVVKNNWEITYY